jgi:hypothetical protein
VVVEVAVECRPEAVDEVHRLEAPVRRGGAGGLGGGT